MIEVLTDELCEFDIGSNDAAPCTASLVCINEMLDALPIAAYGCASAAFGCAAMSALDSALDPTLVFVALDPMPDVAVAGAFGLAPNAEFSLFVVLFKVAGLVFAVVQKLQMHEGLFLVDGGNDFCCDTIFL